MCLTTISQMKLACAAALCLAALCLVGAEDAGVQLLDDTGAPAPKVRLPRLSWPRRDIWDISIPIAPARKWHSLLCPLVFARTTPPLWCRVTLMV
jgi:hypothetical protein